MSELSIRAEQRLNGLRDERTPYWSHWREIADYVLPRRYRWLVTPNDPQRGAFLNNRILDSTATIALRVLASGMMSGITSPSRPWFKLRLDTDLEDSSAGALWLDEVEKRMLRVFSESNFYNSIAQVYEDLASFGTAVMLVYEDFEDVIRCYNPCAGEYYLANSAKLNIDTVYREFTMTTAQLVEEFGKENVSDAVRANLESPGNAEREIVVGHCIEPNVVPRGGVPKRFRYREVYWERSRTSGASLRERGFNEFPAIAPRWDVTGNDAYGRSPAMDALGDIKQLQQETKRKAQAIDKMVNPPLLADIQLKNQPASTLPGGVTYVVGQNNLGMKPIYTVQPPIQELMLDIKEVQARIKGIFFNDLFMMFQELQAEPRSAAAVDARREEKLVMLGPVLERLHNEALDPVIDRVFGIMHRAGLFPPTPPEIAGANIKVEYVSMLAEAQRATATTGIERVVAMVGNLAGAVPQVLDVPDWDDIVTEYASLLGVSPKLINAQKVIAAIREHRAQAAQAQQAATASMAAVEGAKNLSQTEVGGGQNALQAMLGGGGTLQ